MHLPVTDLAEPLATEAERAWERILDRAGSALADTISAALIGTPDLLQLPRVLACSPFIAELLQRRPEWLPELLADGWLQQPLPEKAFREELHELLAAADVDASVVLRRYRARHMLRIVWRDFCRLADTLETVRDTSLLADAAIAESLQYVQVDLQDRYGVPRGRHSGAEQQLIVLAMGKLGAGELNVSSDIDLIFAFPEAGQTDGETQSLSNEEFFTRVGQALINLLDQITAEGFVFRVDMRLRPYGESGALVHNFAALEDYYQDQGRDWERYAMIKARPVTGDPRSTKELMAMLRPFVFRRYIDFGVIESLRGMKQMISTEVRRRGLQDNVKLGHGGIREVEFIAQCFQLIRGGRDLGLQQRELLSVLNECIILGCLPQEDVTELRAAYLFLRDSEHAIQGYKDKQSQELPTGNLARAAMATVMGYTDWEEYHTALAAHRERVAEHFSELIATPEENDTAATESDLPDLWGEELSEGSLQAAGYRQPGASLQALQALLDSSRVMLLQHQGRQRLDQFMPELLRVCAELVAQETDSEAPGFDAPGPGTPGPGTPRPGTPRPGSPLPGTPLPGTPLPGATLPGSPLPDTPVPGTPDHNLVRVLPLVVAVVRRSAYLVLLLENPLALEELVRLCGASPWISEELASNPVLLDELLDRASLYTAPDKSLLQDELRQQVARLAVDDLEAQMDALRYFKASHVLRVAASELAGRLPLMQVSDKLTWIAEVILEQVLAIAWADLTQKYGQPNRDSVGPGFAIFGYGKLGGIELGYGSDLDLVFVYEGAVSGVTDGSQSIDNAVFYTRLGQRIIHILQTRMSMGQLYEVDMRLRPSGDSGMLVSTVAAFRTYQQDSAWTWEHQALVRARFVAGDAEVADKVQEVREQTLCQKRDPAALAQDVHSMREKMRKHLLPHGLPEDGEFHLKQGAGGIVDIEFMVQYAVLAWSHREPELARWSDNVRILEILGRTGLFEPQECEALTQAYLAYRSAAHQLSLQQQPDVVPAGNFVDARAAVSAKWQQLIAPYNNDNTDE